MPVAGFSVFSQVVVLPANRRAAGTRTGVPVLRREVADRSLAGRRVALGVTQAWVADSLGISRQTVQRAELRPRHARGVRADARQTARRLAEFYRGLEQRGASS